MIFAILKGIGKTLLAIAVGAFLSLIFYIGMKIAGDIATLFILIGIILIFLSKAVSDEINEFKVNAQHIDNQTKMIAKLSQRFEDTIEELEERFLSSGGHKTEVIDYLVDECENIIQKLSKYNTPDSLHIHYEDQLRELLEFYNY